MKLLTIMMVQLLLLVGPSSSATQTPSTSKNVDRFKFVEGQILDSVQCSWHDYDFSQGFISDDSLLAYALDKTPGEPVFVKQVKETKYSWIGLIRKVEAYDLYLVYDYAESKFKTSNIQRPELGEENFLKINLFLFLFLLVHPFVVLMRTRNENLLWAGFIFYSSFPLALSLHFGLSLPTFTIIFLLSAAIIYELWFKERILSADGFSFSRLGLWILIPLISMGFLAFLDNFTLGGIYIISTLFLIFPSLSYWKKKSVDPSTTEKQTPDATFDNDNENSNI